MLFIYTIRIIKIRDLTLKIIDEYMNKIEILEEALKRKEQ